MAGRAQTSGGQGIGVFPVEHVPLNANSREGNRAVSGAVATKSGEIVL